MKSLFGACAVTLGLLAASSLTPAAAETMTIKADLNGPSETPPNDSKGTGSLTGTFDTDSKKLTWEVTFSGLTGPVTVAHFHGPAPVGKPAGIEVPVAGPYDSPMKGSATLTDNQAKDLTTGNMYFNLHTAKHQKGELRGQVSAGK